MIHVSGIGAVVEVVDSHLWEWGSIHGKNCNFLIVYLSKGLLLCFMCSDQHVKYWMPDGFPLTSSLLLDYLVKQHTHLSSIWFNILVRETRSNFLNLCELTTKY